MNKKLQKQQQREAQAVVNELAGFQTERGWTNAQMAGAINAAGLSLPKRTYDNWRARKSGNLPRPATLFGLRQALAHLKAQASANPADPQPAPAEPADES